MNRIAADLTMLTVGVLIVVQVTCASYGARYVSDLAGRTRAQLAAVAHAAR
jgi:hypothetical protein